MSRYDDLSRRLFAAIDNNDIEAIARLRADGAKADHPVATEESDNEITPVFHAIATEKPHLIEPLIGTGGKAVPLAMILSMGREYDLYEAIVDRCESFLYTDSVEVLTTCLDVEAPAVAHAMWNAASMALDPVNDDEFPKTALVDCARTILWEGGYPERGAAYAEVLGARTGRGLAGAPLTFLDDLDPECHHMYERWFRHGLSPDANVSGMPLLHNFAISDWADLVALALEAGANPAATCSYETFDRNLPASQRKNEIPVGQVVSVSDAARDGDNPRTTQVLEAHRAKTMIDTVLAAARTGRAP